MQPYLLQPSEKIIIINQQIYHTKFNQICLHLAIFPNDDQLQKLGI